MKKREKMLLYLLFTMLFILCKTAMVSADTYEKYAIYVDSTRLDGNAVIQAFDGFSYIPLNQTKAALNMTVQEEASSSTAVISGNGKTVKLLSTDTAELSDGSKIQLTVPVVRKDNNLYMPVLVLKDVFGYQVEIMDDIKCVRIKTAADATPLGKLVDSELSKKLPSNKPSSSSYPRVAYLTFDDGLDSKITPMILDILKENDVKATFFIVGNTVERNKTLLKRMLAEGHIIGNHSYTHKKENLYEDAKDLKGEIDKTNTALYHAAGISTKLFRPPYGGTYIKKAELQAVLTPYKTILWNVDSMDSRSRTITRKEILNNVINQVKNKKSAVIIMHDSGTHIETAKALPDIIKYLKDNNFTILPVKEDTSIYYQY
jgi:peptidoglycan/xylan/chitin deacetylase (PgdA/CDA1 family)